MCWWGFYPPPNILNYITTLLKLTVAFVLVASVIVTVRIQFVEEFAASTETPAIVPPDSTIEYSVKSTPVDPFDWTRTSELLIFEPCLIETTYLAVVNADIAIVSRVVAVLALTVVAVADAPSTFDAPVVVANVPDAGSVKLVLAVAVKVLVYAPECVTFPAIVIVLEPLFTPVPP